MLTNSPLHKLVAGETLEALGASEGVQRRLAILAEYDLSFLTRQFVEDELGDFSPEQLFPLIRHFGHVDQSVAERLELEFRRFIAITLLKPGRRNSPSGPVDMYWHFFVLHTEDYIAFCNAIWGSYGPQPRTTSEFRFQTMEDKKRYGFVDHVPATDDTRPMMFTAYLQTRDAYAEIFGDPDEQYWPPRGTAKATCGDSYSGFVPPVSDD